MHDLKPVRPIGPLKPFACTYYHDMHAFGITLWATSEKEILSMGHDLPGLRVEGILIAEAPA